MTMEGDPMRIEFPKDQLESPDDYDLCTKVIVTREIYVDIIRRDGDGTWSVVWDNRRAVEKLKSRDEAVEWLNQHADALASGRFDFCV